MSADNSFGRGEKSHLENPNSREVMRLIIYANYAAKPFNLGEVHALVFVGQETGITRTNYSFVGANDSGLNAYSQGLANDLLLLARIEAIKSKAFQEKRVTLGRLTDTDINGLMGEPKKPNAMDSLVKVSPKDLIHLGQLIIARRGIPQKVKTGPERRRRLITVLSSVKIEESEISKLLQIEADLTRAANEESQQ